MAYSWSALDITKFFGNFFLERLGSTLFVDVINWDVGLYSRDFPSPICSIRCLHKGQRHTSRATIRRSTLNVTNCTACGSKQRYSAAKRRRSFNFYDWK
jgi:hypothetical protein